MSEKMASCDGSRHACASLLCVSRCARATPALGDDIIGKKPAVDHQIDSLSGQLAAHRQSEQALRNEIDGVTARIRTLEANVGDVSLQLSTLEQDLALHRERLAKLNELFSLQSAGSSLLQRSTRSPSTASTGASSRSTSAASRRLLEFVLGVASIDDVLDKVDYMGRIAREDREIAHEVATAKLAMAAGPQAHERRCASRSRAPRT